MHRGRVARFGIGAAIMGVSLVSFALVTSIGMGVDSAYAKPSLFDDPEEEEAGEPFTWSDDADCSLCHVNESESVADASLLISTHEAVDCMFCHDYDAELAAGGGAVLTGDETSEDEADGSEAVELESVPGAAAAANNPTMAEVHADVTNVSTVKRGSLVATSISDEPCLTCHDPDELKEATADDETLKDANGLVINPHDIPASDQHNTITCESCHTMHKTDEMASYRACVSCHHAEIWECGTCHEYTSDTTGGTQQ